MATKNRIAYALPIIQIMQIPLAKLPIQICLRLVCGERVGIVATIPKAQYLRGFSGFFFFSGTRKVHGRYTQNFKRRLLNDQQLPRVFSDTGENKSPKLLSRFHAQGAR